MIFDYKNILIMGYGESGKAVENILKSLNIEYKIYDKSHGVNGGGYLCKLNRKIISNFDLLVISPGISIYNKYVVMAERMGIKVVGELEFGYWFTSSPVVAITGTNGKTTTTTLTYEIMKKAFGDKVFLVGNIGYPFSSILDELKSGDIVVMEVSCQQLENLSTFNPHVALMTNLSPAHIDFLKSYDNYKRVKAKLFKNQSSDDVAILNIDNQDVLDVTKDIKSTVKYFSSNKEINGAYLKDGAIYYYGEKVMDTDKVFIAGKHNLENCMGAIMITKEFGVSNEIIEEVISNFRGVEHRLEYVDTVYGRMFYNDTEATNIKCTQIALSSFEKPIIIILGGLERGQDFNELKPYMKNVKGIIGIGQCRDRVLDFGNGLGIPTYSFEHLSDGFDKCVEISDEGDVILLSPASASWDQYKECEIRGREFKDKVKEIKNED